MSMNINKANEFISPGKPGSQETMNIPPLTLSLKFYDNFRPCILASLRSGEPYGKLSINLPEKYLAPNQFFAKIYSENAHWAPKVLDALPYWFTKTPRRTFLTYGNIAPVYELTNRFIAEQFELTYDSKSDIYQAEEPLWDLYKLYCEV